MDQAVRNTDNADKTQRCDKECGMLLMIQKYGGHPTTNNAPCELPHGKMMSTDSKDA